MAASKGHRELLSETRPTSPKPTTTQGDAMKSLKALTGMLALAASVAILPGASAQTLQVLTAGSSAQFGPFAVAAYALATAGSTKAFHYTVKSGACPGSSCYA